MFKQVATKRGVLSINDNKHITNRLIDIFIFNIYIYILFFRLKYRYKVTVLNPHHTRETDGQKARERERNHGMLRKVASPEKPY